jgi:hypothetical protein
MITYKRQKYQLKSIQFVIRRDLNGVLENSLEKLELRSLRDDKNDGWCLFRTKNSALR